jgi:hypothetical protein
MLYRNKKIIKNLCAAGSFSKQSSDFDFRQAMYTNLGDPVPVSLHSPTSQKRCSIMIMNPHGTALPLSRLGKLDFSPSTHKYNKDGNCGCIVMSSLDSHNHTLREKKRSLRHKHQNHASK